MLSGEDPSQPVYFGHHFSRFAKQGYFSGGPGYVLSKEALTRFKHRNTKECKEDHTIEDVKIGKCLETLGVVTGDARDSLNRTRFHCFSPYTHVEGNYPNWYYTWNKYKIRKVSIEAVFTTAKTCHAIQLLGWGGKGDCLRKRLNVCDAQAYRCLSYTRRRMWT